VSTSELKQVIVVNAELNLSKGKLASQVAHAAVAAFLEAPHTVKSAWLSTGMPKVVLKAPVKQCYWSLRLKLVPLACR
jgi:PTH2 family peptidyl-tRNA hydrolase